ncbi:MAG: hypothetical protein IPN17_36870 [Deltaproteobacteria bacterium]|nr:hypothetical protein [Deltaproteobacteria bacterium]
MPAKKPSPKKPDPRSLAARAKAAHAARMERVAKSAWEAIDRVRALRRGIESDFLEIGTALVALKADGIPEALNLPSFEAVLETHLDISLTKAEQLITVATRVRRELAEQLGQDHAAALVELADATPDDETPDDLFNATLTLPDGARFVVRDEKPPRLRAAAAMFRQARSAKKGRGLTTSPTERRMLSAIRAQARTVKALARARFDLKATHHTDGADLVVRIPLSHITELASALSKVARATRKPSR